jgi:hypothetical protein
VDTRKRDPRIGVTADPGPMQDAEHPVIRNRRIHDPFPGTRLSSVGVFGWRGQNKSCPAPMEQMRVQRETIQEDSWEKSGSS